MVIYRSLRILVFEDILKRTCREVKEKQIPEMPK
jgi:hypothetical protein